MEIVGVIGGLLLLALGAYGFANLRRYPSADEDRSTARDVALGS